MDLGATLRNAREARGVTCEALAHATRISPRILLAMERNDWTKVPGGIFARGYLRAYAREVGIDAVPLVMQFDAEQAPPEPPPAATTPVGARELPAGWPRWTVPGAAAGAAWPTLGVAVVVVGIDVHRQGRSVLMQEAGVQFERDVLRACLNGYGLVAPLKVTQCISFLVRYAKMITVSPSPGKVGVGPASVLRSHCLVREEPGRERSRHRTCTVSRE